MDTNFFPEFVINELIKQEKTGYRANSCVCYSPNVAQYLEVVTLLHPLEREYFQSLVFERRIKSYLVGRFAAKQAVSFLIGGENPEQVCITQGIFNQPIVVHANKINIQVSITHCDDFGAAIAFPEALPMGIDMERIHGDKKQVLATQMSVKEIRIVDVLPYSEEAKLTLLWTAKEAMSKAIKTGLTIPFLIFEINRIEWSNGIIRSYFENFPQFVTDSFIFDRYIFSITYPKRTIMDITPLRDLLNERIIVCQTA